MPTRSAGLLAWFLSLSAGLGLAATAAAAQDLPPGFVRQLVTDQLDATTAMAWGPDGHLWVAGRTGQIWVLHLEHGGEPEIEQVAQLDVDTEGERGVGGLAVDPDYGDARHVWVYYTTAEEPIRNRLSRFRHVGDQLVDETVVVDGPVLEHTIHNGGCVRFASDGSLFVSVGDDDQRDVTAQDPHDIRGKILHIDRDGNGLPDNPFALGGGDPRVWALGLRNPWRFSLDPESQTPIIGDVGGDAFEELDLGIPGGNYGWSLAEGPDPAGIAGITYPIHSYPHTDPRGHAIVAGGHAPPGGFPEEYVGNYFYGDAATGELTRVSFDDSYGTERVEPFTSDTVAGPVDVQFGPDGALYYLTYWGGMLFRIAYVGSGNAPPRAVARAEPTSGAAPLTVELDGTGSEDLDGDTLAYEWDAGDGEPRRDAVVTVDYPAGVHHATLKVRDATGQESTSSPLRIVSGNEPPRVSILSPLAGSLYSEGQTIPFSGQAWDPEEGVLPCAQLTWRVVFHHKGHTHPFLGPLQGTCSGSFRIESHGQTGTYFAIHLAASDAGTPLGVDAALSAQARTEIHPGAQ